MDTAVTTPTGCPVVARGLAAGAVGGAPLGWLIVLTLLAPGESWGLLPDALLVSGVVGAVIGATVGLLSGIVLAVRETGAGRRTDRNRRIAAAMTSAAPFILGTALLASDSPRGWWSGLAIAAMSAAAGAALAPYVVNGRDLCG